MGQHFLTDHGLLAKIASCARGHPALEIGAGPGNLTVFLAAEARRVIAVERDPRLVSLLRKSTAELAHVEAVKGNFLNMDLGTILGDDGPWVCVSNLPYCSSTPILFRLLEHIEFFSLLCVSLQREVAERLCAVPGSRAFGRLSVMAGVLTVPKMLFRLSPGVFYPRPEVESALVQLRPHQRYRDRLQSFEDFSAVVKAAFGQRRKRIANALRAVYGSQPWGDRLTEAFDRAGLEPTLRAEQLSVDQFVDLTNEITALRSQRTNPAA
jgi:16S rRNA (adenine1518-N6/adenine1519-N6)-dimethyltransferase